jgi:hypothetical protein
MAVFPADKMQNKSFSHAERGRGRERERRQKTEKTEKTETLGEWVHGRRRRR